MKPGLPMGETYEFSVQVTADMQARFGDEIVHPLYSTAAMINHMEWAARQHIVPYLEEGEEGVGCHVDVRHLAPTPVGATVRIRSTVTGIEPRRIISRVEAWRGSEKIGEGTFTQALVPVAKLTAVQETGSDPSLDEPPPAVLAALDGAQPFSLEILKWAAGGLACTRYDEWLICRIRVGAQTLEAPVLLRYEIEEWAEALQALAQGAGETFRSDFLDAALAVEIQGGADHPCQVRLKLSESTDTPGSGTPVLVEPVVAEAAVSPEALGRFARQLAEQLEGFPSRL